MMQAFLEATALAVAAMALGASAGWRGHRGLRRALAVGSVLVVVAALPLRLLATQLPAAFPTALLAWSESAASAPSASNQASEDAPLLAASLASLEGVHAAGRQSLPEPAHPVGSALEVVPAWSWRTAVGLLAWALGAGWRLARTARVRSRLNSLLAGSRPLPRDWQGEWATMLANCGASTPEIRLCDGLRSPFSCCFEGRPLIVLPSDLLQSSARTWLGDVVRHELAHLEHRDDQVAVLQSLARACFWFVPGVDRWSRVVDGVLEEAADQAVVKAGADPRAYAGTLLDLADRAVLRGARAFGGTRSSLARRVQVLVGGRGVRRSTLRPALPLLLLIGLAVGAAGCGTAHQPLALRAAQASQRSLRTLYVEDEPRWDFRYGKTELLQAPNLQVHSFLSTADASFVQECSPGLEPLADLPALDAWPSQYDLLILGEISPERLAARCGVDESRLEAGLRAFVQEGGTLLLWTAATPFPWCALAGVTPAAEASSDDRLVRARVRASWSKVLPVEGLALDRIAALQESPLVEVRARSVRGLPLVMRRPLGRGSVWTLPVDGSWRWRAAPGSPEVYRAFWKGVISEIAERMPAPPPPDPNKGPEAEGADQESEDADGVGSGG